MYSSAAGSLAPMDDKGGNGMARFLCNRKGRAARPRGVESVRQVTHGSHRPQRLPCAGHNVVSAPARQPLKSGWNWSSKYASEDAVGFRRRASPRHEGGRSQRECAAATAGRVPGSSKSWMSYGLLSESIHRPHERAVDRVSAGDGARHLKGDATPNTHGKRQAMTHSKEKGKRKASIRSMRDGTTVPDGDD
jgi:hypothetical protein